MFRALQLRDPSELLVNGRLQCSRVLHTSNENFTAPIVEVEIVQEEPDGEHLLGGCQSKFTIV